MREFGNTTVSFFLAIIIIIAGISAAGADINTGIPKYNGTPLPAIMGPDCPEGELLFYGQLTNTRSEEKLCKVTDKEYYFFTRDGEKTRISSAKVTDVKKVHYTGKSGYSNGYDFSLLTGDVIKFRAVFSNKGPVPLAGFFIVNDNIIDLDPLTVTIK